jgi:signal transduction histidine kinase
MKILGEELGDVGRWYIALPPLLLIGFLVGLFFLAAAGQSRLNAADERVHDTQLRLQTLSEFMAFITDAESAERGYLLTGEPSSLWRYRDAVAQIAPALERVHAAFAAGEPSAEIRRLRALTRARLAEFNASIALYREEGAASGASIERAEAGKQTMDDIAKIVGTLRQQEATQLSETTAQWLSDLHLSHWITLAGAVLNIGLVVLASVLVYGDMRRRARQATDLRDQKHELERQVDQRTRELTALSTHLQGVSEQEKSALSRELHDELGGLLVAARMDLSWLQQRLPTSEPSIEQRFRRIHESLSAGVDLKRRVVEELRPTLLDNMGLFAALRWQFKESCRRNGLHCTETIPETELKFHPDAAIGVFRIAQEALTNILKHADAKSADLAIEIDDQAFLLRVSDDGKGIALNRLKTISSHGLASMRHRVTALGGSWDVRGPVSGGTVVTARIPMARMLLGEHLPLPMSQT